MVRTGDGIGAARQGVDDPGRRMGKMSAGDPVMPADLRKTFLVVSQTYVPDTPSVGQHMADVAVEMARRGHRVRVYASGRGYEDASRVFPSREMRDGVEVRRFPWASFGKRNILVRALGTLVFHIQAFFAALFTPGLEAIFFSTSPPLIGLPMCIVAAMRRVPALYWAMDLNPDQLIALGKIRRRGPSALILESANRFILRRSNLIVALDRYMADRLRSRFGPGRLDARLRIVAPWPLADEGAGVGAGENAFRVRYDLADKFVVMYSGNHSPSNPLATILDAAMKLREDDSIWFVFIGGGAGKRDVDALARQRQAANILSLPYQPLAMLGESLSAADVHIVTLGSPMVGIVHPCKVYGAMAVARPVLYVGPRRSHIGDLLDQADFAVHVEHGDADGAVAAIRALRDRGSDSRGAMGRRGRELLCRSLTRQTLRAALCDELEKCVKEEVSRRGARAQREEVP
jgi:glycosyltransferase involved in cell wall biosynthesis